MGGNNEFFENFERNKYLKKLPSMQRDKYEPRKANALKRGTLPKFTFLFLSIKYFDHTA